MEVAAAAGDAADHLMDLDEQLGKFSSVTYKEKQERNDEAIRTPISLTDHEERKNIEPVGIIPYPVQPVTTLSTPISNVKPAGSTLGFTINGRPVHLQPGGGAKLRLQSYPEGSASGFTKILIHTPVGNHYVTTTAASTTAASSSLGRPPSPVVSSLPSLEPIPVITGIVSGEAAEKVLNERSVNPNSSVQRSEETRLPAVKQKKKNLLPSARPSKIAAPEKLLRKGEIGATTPPDCQICKSQYKLIAELRGFMCMCCPEIAQSLINLRKQRVKLRRRARERRKDRRFSKGALNSTRESHIQPVVSPAKVRTPPPRRRICSPVSDDLSDELSSPTSPSLTSPAPPPDQLLPVDYPPSKLVIMVEDFFYGRAAGSSNNKDNTAEKKSSGDFHCIHCSTVLSNNIKLMDHMEEHIPASSQENGHVDTGSICPHCFRHFASPLSLQCHMKDVHSQNESTVMCKICELAFENEPALLCHMKSIHKPGEMPYACQVCEFRSSFYSEVWSHFREVHSDTRDLLCRYCLRVLHSNVCYQQHFARHQKKQTLSCDKCRLHFLYVRERAEHKTLLHNTHVTPPQLSRLKPGTKVTVRMYSVIGGSEPKEELNKVYVPSKVVDVASAPLEHDFPKQTQVERLGTLLSGLSADSDFDPNQRCLECLKSIQDPKIHFPTRVHCSFCLFTTCCSNSYANHMINNHTVWMDPQLPNVFEFNPRLPEALRCDSCTFSTFSGDAMANHITERPDHVCVTLTDEEKSPKKLKIQTPYGDAPVEKTEKVDPGSKNEGPPVRQKIVKTNGMFVPIQLVPNGLTSPQLSVKALGVSSSPAFKPAMTIKIMGVGKRFTPLSRDQLDVVLSSLCHGVSETARHTGVPAATIRSWIASHQRGLDTSKWGWRTDKMAEWVLDRREQQLSVTESVLLATAAAALGESSRPDERLSWTVDFMLRHDLGLQTTNNNRLRSIRECSRSFMHSLYSQIQKGVLPLNCWGCMDELPVYIDLDLFSKQHSSAFQLFGSPEAEPVFDVVLAALSDGRLLPPLLFFRGLAASIPDGFPDNVLLEARETGFTDEERLQIWFDKVWLPCVTSNHHDDGSLLMMDVHRGHLGEMLRDLLSSAKTAIAFIPAGCSCRLQPLEICVAQVLRDFLQARWSQLVSDGGLEGLGLDQLALTMACWLSEVSSTLNSQTDILRRSFTLACSLQHLDHKGEAARIITALTDALTQPAEVGSPEPKPTLGWEQEHPPLEHLLLLTKKEKNSG